MKITFILPGIGVSGGVRSTLEVANRLYARGHDVTVVYPLVIPYSGEKWNDLSGIMRRVKGTLDNAVRGPAIRWFELKARSIRPLTLAERYIPKGDVIVATWWANAYDINGYARDKGRKFYFIRSYETWGGPAELVDGTYSLPLTRITTSLLLKRTIEEKFGVPVEGVVPNGINPDIFYVEGAREGVRSPKRVGIMSKPGWVKGLEDGLEAFRAAKEKYLDARLVIFGKRPVGKAVRLVRSIGDVEVYPWLNGDELRRLYNSLDIFVYPSRYEGFGNPPMEAMACGAACVLTDVGAVKDYAEDGKTALISPPGDISAMSANILKLLKDENMRRGIAEEGRRAISKFTWDNSVDELERIFDGKPA